MYAMISKRLNKKYTYIWISYLFILLLFRIIPIIFIRKKAVICKNTKILTSNVCFSLVTSDKLILECFYHTKPCVLLIV